MKTWQKRNWMDCECCGIDGAIEVETDATDDNVCDGDRARCTLHCTQGVVLENG